MSKLKAAPANIKTMQGWLYLTIILDLTDRRVIGWALSSTMKAIDTLISAWNMACKNRSITNKLIFHSDRGNVSSLNNLKVCVLLKLVVGNTTSKVKYAAAKLHAEILYLYYFLPSSSKLIPEQEISY
ncbi:DDE-type integrase/transposase/recombinase [Dyadobacter sediminis]|uniref:DDE-type integrase/transposase/recombinase n=1 Tax=Dyadobacter sediminis TaxID=1493691 RepID=A0A5R9KGK1_9BACT|nr:DDE-type integrase/transposase/recombinase [Dyadobacter sediminis]